MAKQVILFNSHYMVFQTFQLEVENKMPLGKWKWKRFLTLQPEFFKIIYNLPKWTK